MRRRTGYHDRLVGQAIPIGARIVAVCDAFDAMTSDRPYRRAMTAEAAPAELRRCSGTQFDAAVVEVLVRVVAAGGRADAAAAGPRRRAA